MKNIWTKRVNAGEPGEAFFTDIIIEFAVKNTKIS